jgi:hypothetical protein
MMYNTSAPNSRCTSSRGQSRRSHEKRYNRSLSSPSVTDNLLILEVRAVPHQTLRCGIMPGQVAQAMPLAGTETRVAC